MLTKATTGTKTTTRKKTTHRSLHPHGGFPAAVWKAVFDGLAQLESRGNIRIGTTEFVSQGNRYFVRYRSQDDKIVVSVMPKETMSRQIELRQSNAIAAIDAAKQSIRATEADNRIPEPEKEERAESLSLSIADWEEDIKQCAKDRKKLLPSYNILIPIRDWVGGEFSVSVYMEDGEDDAEKHEE